MPGIRIIVGDGTPQMRKLLAGIQDRLNRAITTSMRMAQAMLQKTAEDDIASAGNFGSRWTDGLHVNLQGSAPNMKLSMTHDIPYASIFETGGVIHGSPLLWIPLSGTSAEGIRAAAFGEGLVSQRKTSQRGGRPLLFSVTDRQPKYFGVESVTIPQTFHLNDDVNSVMSNFRSIFDSAWSQS
jgi:hypothetical protein